MIPESGRRSPKLWVPIVIVLLIGCGWLLLRPAPQSGDPAETKSPNPGDSVPAVSDLSGRSTLADELNAPGGTIARDLEIVASVLEAFRTNFPVAGNPVGENFEITAALMGRNEFALRLIPRGHPAVNVRGELIDRWGTPFFFHQLGAHEMEIRSAGPDRQLYTEDDVLLTPGS